MSSRLQIALVFTALSLPILVPPATAARQLEDKWGSPGSAPGQFSNPFGIAVGSLEVVYVADTDNHRIQKFLGDGTFLMEWGSEGSGNGQFDVPRGVAVAPNGNVYVADSNNDRIQYFDAFGVYLGQWGGSGSDDGKFAQPRALAVAGDGSVYVTEDAFSQKRVQKFTPTGTFVGKWGTTGTGDGQFSGPRGIAVDEAGFVYVSDSLNDRVQKFTSNGGFVLKWGQSGSGNGQFSLPIGVACLGDRVIVVDSGNSRFQIFSSTGVYQEQFGSSCRLSDGLGCVDPDGAGPLESGDAQFYIPRAVTVDPVGHILVLDGGNSRVMEIGDPQTIGVTDPLPPDAVRLAAGPNPFQATIRLSVQVPERSAEATDSFAVVRVLDVAGREVRRLWSGVLPAGNHSFSWNGRTDGGDSAPEGMYFAIVELDGVRAAAAKIVRVR